MCFNKEISLLLFVLGFLTSIKFFLKKTINDDKIASLTLTVSFMQLAEFFLWIYLKNKSVNLIISKIIPILIWGQVAGVFFIKVKEWAESRNNSNNSNNFTTNQPQNIANVVLFCIFSFLILWLSVNTTDPAYKDKLCGRLVWTFEGDKPVFKLLIFIGIFLSVLILSGIDIEMVYIGAVTIFLSLIYSFLRKVSFSATWCLLVVLIIIVYGIFK